MRAQKALGARTIRETVESALRRAAESDEREQADRAERQRAYLHALPTNLDLAVLASDEMWR
jgi:Arc/MetJ family transcription regulator